MKTIERLRAVLATVEVAPDIMSVPELNAWCDCRDELINAIPALLAVVEAAAKLHKAMYPTCGADARARWIIDGSSTAPSELHAALRALEGGD